MIVDSADNGLLREKIEFLSSRAKQRALSLEFHLGSFHLDVLEGVDLVVTSPGVPSYNPLLEEACKRGAKVWSELELSSRFTRSPIIAITGTNGKTTTTLLLAHILKSSGKDVWVGGNIGSPLSALLMEKASPEWVILEVSSFQLEWVEKFHPRMAAIINLTEDHLDRHHNVKEYLNIKLKITMNQRKEDLLLLNSDTPYLRDIDEVRATIYRFGFGNREEPGIFCTEDAMMWREEGGTERVMDLSVLPLIYRHNIENIMAAFALARLAGVDFQIMVTALKGFAFSPHRLELVKDIAGIKFYDDSKATNPGAVAKALRTLSPPVMLLIGGKNKRLRFDPLKRLVREKVKVLFIFGESAQEISGDLAGLCERMEVFERMAEAVGAAMELAAPGDTVLFSPGCTSFDEFSNYKERGEAFRCIVHAYFEGREFNT